MLEKFKKTFNSTDSYISLALGFAVVVAVGMLIFNFIQSNRQEQEEQKQAEEQQKREEAQASPTPPTKHTVQKGETLWGISEKYKSGYNWVDIAKANALTNAHSI